MKVNSKIGGKLAAFPLKYFNHTSDFVASSKIKSFKRSFCSTTNDLLVQ